MNVLKISETTNSIGFAFRLNCGNDRIRTATVKQDYKTQHDGILWALLEPAMICSSYSQEEQREQSRLNACVPVEHDGLVFIGEDLYRCKVNGEYSDAAIFEPVLDASTMTEVSNSMREYIGDMAAMNSIPDDVLVMCYSEVLEQNNPEIMTKFLGL